jgi:putative transcriptional regulator
MAFLAGSFLVARPVLQDPSFRRAVVLLLQHGPEGAFGLVVNRPAKAKGVPFPVFRGGPCESPGLFMLHGHEDWLEGPDTSSVAAGIFVGDSDSAQRVNDDPENADFRYRMFTGYAGWGPKQLEGELSAGAWAVVPANGEVLFDTPSDDLWANLLPPSLPEFSRN